MNATALDELRQALGRTREGHQHAVKRVKDTAQAHKEAVASEAFLRARLADLVETLNDTTPAEIPRAHHEDTLGGDA